MIRRAIEFAPEARDDLLAIYDWIADAASPESALGYLQRLETFIAGFDVASERGTRRDDVRPGLRTIGFERRATIAFAVAADRVSILRVFYAGRDWQSALSEH